MQLFFITGRGRSGTWLLNTVLSAHPDISVAPESLFIEVLASRFGKVKEWNDSRKLNFIHALLEDQKIEKWWHLDKAELLIHFDTVPKNASYADICLIPYRIYAEANGKSDAKLVGDKNPEYALRIPQLIAKFPDTKIICMVRDPRDNIISYTNVNFDSNNPIVLAYRWRHYNQEILKAKARFPHHILVCRFEDLINEPEDTLQKICDFLEIEYNDSMLNFHENPKNVFEWNKKITSSFDTKVIGKWKNSKTLKPVTIRKIEAITRELCATYNYSNDKKELSLHEYPIVGLLKATVLNVLEKTYFKLPFWLKSRIIKIYRKITKTF